MDSGFFPLVVLLKMTNQAWAGFGFIPANSYINLDFGETVGITG